LGYKHSEDSLKLMSEASKKRNELEEVLKSKREVMLGRKLSKDHLERMAKNNPFRVSIILSSVETGKRAEFTSMTQAAMFLGVHMTTIKRYLMANKRYNGYMITKSTSGLDSSSISNLTNEWQAVRLTNSVTGITKELSTMKAACQLLGISPRRLSNYLKNNESSFANEQASTIKGYKIIKIDSVKRNGKALEVTNICTNKVTKYSSVSSASEAIGISLASIYTYLRRKRISPYKNTYLFKWIEVV